VLNAFQAALALDLPGAATPNRTGQIWAVASG